MEARGSIQCSASCSLVILPNCECDCPPWHQVLPSVLCRSSMQCVKSAAVLLLSTKLRGHAHAES